MDVDQQVQRVRELLEGPARRGASANEIAAAEYRLGVSLPLDVRALVTAFDGSDYFTPLEHGRITFWPLSSWHRVSDEPNLSESPLQDGIMFADHGQSSWFYALKMTGEASLSAVYLISGLPEEPPLVADSMSGFLQAVIDDASVLYRKAAGD